MSVNGRICRVLTLVCFVWSLILIFFLTTMRTGWKPQHTISPCQETQTDLNRSTRLREKLDNLILNGVQDLEFSKLTDLDQSEYETILKCIDSLAAAEPPPDDYHKKFWPPKSAEGDPGYGGKPVYMELEDLTDREEYIYEQGFEIYLVNQLASDMISVRRDIRLPIPVCHEVEYDITSLPRAGVVVIFHNELWSVLFRTVFSILDAGPDHLITEIVLVDDASDKEHLGKPLEDYLLIFNGKVKLVRLPERKGLIHARMTGFEHVTGDVAVFLDGHCEVHRGWLEPLLLRIKEDNSVLAVPITDRINDDTFEYEFMDMTHPDKGGFDLDMNFNWIYKTIDDGVEVNLLDPVRSPTHLGCCFAIFKDTFERLGRYDPGLEIWGCENLELSFKAWMCGGSVEIIPCSHVGHMYREAFPYSWGPNPKYTLIQNCLRVAEVWMDEYKYFYYERINQLQKKVDMGDISDRRALREELQCHSFDWYVKEVYPELYLPLNTSASGMISSVADPTLCLSFRMGNGLYDEEIITAVCNELSTTLHFALTKEKQIRRDQSCLSFDQKRMCVVARLCHLVDSTWMYTKENNIVNVESGLCLTLVEDMRTNMVVGCRKNNPYQQWIWPRRSVVLP